MNPHATVQTLEESSEFRDWRSSHQGCELAHVFFEPANTQVGFLDPQSQKVTTFVLSDPINVIPDQEVLQVGDAIQPLDLAKVKISGDQAKEGAESLAKEKYANEHILRWFMVLQKLEGQTIYNVTFLTKSFKTINVRIDASSGEVLQESLASLAEFVK